MPLCINELSNLGWLITLPSSIYRVFEAVAGLTLFFFIIIFFSLFLWCNFPSFFFFWIWRASTTIVADILKVDCTPCECPTDLVSYSLLYFSHSLSLYYYFLLHAHCRDLCWIAAFSERGWRILFQQGPLWEPGSVSLSLFILFSAFDSIVAGHQSQNQQQKTPQAFFFFSLLFSFFFRVKLSSLADCWWKKKKKKCKRNFWSRHVEATAQW